MKILLNFATQKKGGGQNVGLNMVKCLINENYDLSQFSFIVARGSLIEKELLDNKVKEVISISENPLYRILFELTQGHKIIKKYKIDIVYTLFGIGLYPKRQKQISGSADSNIFFPEINFWEEYNGLSRLKKILIDKYRISGLKRAHAVIFENEAMLARSKKLYQLKNTFYSKPSINTDFSINTINFPNISPDYKVGLFLCSWQKNKNYMLIPSILSEFKNKGIKYHIVITASKSEKESYKNFMYKIKSYDVEDRVTVIGPVIKSELRSLYEKIDHVFLLSKLESFSNNIIESWFFQKVLVVSDREWAKAICKDAALYVKRNNSSNIVEKILFLENNDSVKKNIISNGNKILKTYPSTKEKIDLQLNFIKSIYESN